MIPTVSIEAGPDHVQISTDHNLKCKIVSELTVSIYWYKDGAALTSKEGKYILSSNQLIIKNVTTADQGHYTCSASNKAGSSTKSNTVQLIAYGK